MANPQLIILAGGASSRMWPLREKSLIKFGAEPLLISQLRNYEKLGFSDVIIVGNPGNEADIKQLLTTLPASMNVQFALQESAKGMGDALLCAAPLVKNPSGAIYINQVHDVVDDVLHESMLKMHKSSAESTYLAGVEMSHYFPGGYLIIDESGRISGIKEKPGAGNEPSRFVNIVVHLHSKADRLFDAIRAEYAKDIPSDDHYERAMDHLMKEIPYRVVGYSGKWDALKFPWHVLDIMERFLSRIKGQTIASDAFVAPTASITGDVIIEAGAKIFPGAAVVGPAYIGKGVIIGNNALVRHSMVLDKSNVGFTTEVARSYVADGVQMHACRVLDSVFAENVNFSAGCTTANLRIDKGNIPSMIKGNKVYSGRDKFGAVIGRDAFLGVDVMTMPGVKIGERANIGPGTHVHQDVKDGSRIYVKQELVIREE
jgi:UDP-N-acetylglucosamine diphosphorylase / glucose-1-phosphate thymidylyltransferase / UDP-N-acetylgalactosamine diphosphorylase / glucosamine-1-phosphate N-acetyltransferase / galactosamine-1-phosphate N-acetyltransferase